MAISDKAPQFDFLPGRKAGRLEIFHIVRSHLRMDTGVIVGARYSGSVTLDKRTLYPALAHLLQHHRALSTQVIRSETNKPSYVYLKSVDLSQIVFFRDPEGEERYQTAEFIYKDHLPFSKPTPLWRLVVLPDNTVIIHYDHSIGDGQSGLGFHKSLLTALNTITPSNEYPPSVVTIPEALQLHPTVEKLTEVRPGLATLSNAIYEVLAPQRLQKLGSSWTGNVVPKTSTTYTNMRILNFSPEDSESLLKICRSNKTTITAFLYTVGGVILGTLLRDSPKKYKYLHNDIPISLRRYTKVPPEDFCVHVSTTHFFPPIIRYSDGVANDFTALAEQFPWDDAAKTAAGLPNRVSRSRELVGALKALFGQYQTYFRDFIGKKRHGTFEISNLGRFPSDPADPKSTEGPWRIENMFFCLCDSWVGAAFKLGVVGSQDGSLGLCFGWGNEAVEESFAISFVDGFRKLVESILAESRT